MDQYKVEPRYKTGWMNFQNRAIKVWKHLVQNLASIISINIPTSIVSTVVMSGVKIELISERHGCEDSGLMFGSG